MTKFNDYNKDCKYYKTDKLINNSTNNQRNSKWIMEILNEKNY